MKTSTLILAFTLLFAATGFAEETPSKAKNTASAKKSTTADYTVKFNNTMRTPAKVDSVYIILDKYDRTGAGVVKKVFYADANNQVIIDDLPEGKYYAEIFVLGEYKQHFSKIIKVEQGKKCNKTVLKVDMDYYCAEELVIPADNFTSFAGFKTRK